MNVKVFLVDDHPLFRSGLRQALAQRSGLTVVGEASTGATALTLAVELAPDLILIGGHLPDMDGVEVTRRILEALPSGRILLLARDPARSRVDDALQAGARGYLSKRSTAAELIQAIEMVMAGKLYLSPEVSVSILEDYRKGLVEEPEPLRPSLSDRDKQLLWLVAEGRRNKDIAVEFTISPKAVEAYRSRLMKKLGCSSLAALVRYTIREGIVAA